MNRRRMVWSTSGRPGGPSGSGEVPRGRSEKELDYSTGTRGAPAAPRGRAAAPDVGVPLMRSASAAFETRLDRLPDCALERLGIERRVQHHEAGGRRARQLEIAGAHARVELARLAIE